MAALVLLIPVVAVTAKIDRSQNKSGYQYDQVNYLKVRHGITPFAFVSIRGEKPSAILFPSCHGAVADPMVLFYHSGICLSIASGDFTVCLFGCAFLKAGQARLSAWECVVRRRMRMPPHAALLDSV